MTTLAEYDAWLSDPENNNYRISLFEMLYASPFGGDGHGREDENATLNEVTSMRLYFYGGSNAEVIFSFPVIAVEYSYEIWINGQQPVIVTGGSHSFPIESGLTYTVDVAAINNAGSYSKARRCVMSNNRPTENWFTESSEVDWNDVGDGTGGDDVYSIKVASDAYLNKVTNNFYDDAIVSEPILDDSLNDFAGVGSIDVVNLDGRIDYLDREFRGYPCRWLVGDKRWLRDDMRYVASSIISGVRKIQGNVYRFDLIDQAQEYQRTFLATDEVITGTVTQVQSALISRTGIFTIVITGYDTESENYQLKLDLTTNSRILEAVQLFADSVGGYMRKNPRADAIRIIVPKLSEGPVTTFTEDDIAFNGVRVIEEIPAYKRVTLKMADDQQVSAATSARTGNLNEEIVIETALVNEADANILLAKKVEYHSKNHLIWEIQTFNRSDLIDAGDVVEIVHEEVSGVGVVHRIKRAPLSRYNTIEVEI